MQIVKHLLLAILTVSLTGTWAQARELKIGTGNFPPYFSEKGTDGLFNDLIKETFRLLPQYRIAFVPQMSNYRLVHSLNNRFVDGAANIFADAKISGCRTHPIFRYTDVAVTRKDRHLRIDTIGDLADKKVVTYQGAKTFLGEQFEKIASADTPLYRELPQPMDQAKSVALGDAEVSVGDLFIFLYSIKNWPNERFTPGQFEVHRLFPDTYSYMGFREQSLCDEFNVALHKLKKSGRYDAIYSRYLKELQ